MAMRVYKVLLQPNNEQRLFLEKQSDACKFVWNWAVAMRKNLWEQEQKSIGVYDQKKLLVPLKQNHTWLNDIDSSALQQVVRDVDKAYKAFYKHHAKGTRPPRFKSQRTYRRSFDIPEHARIVRGRLLWLPKLSAGMKLGVIPFSGYWLGDVTTKSVRVYRDPQHRWWAAIRAEIADIPSKEAEFERTVGIDVGLIDLVVTSDGERFPAPKYYRAAERKLARLQRALARKRKGSKNREKARLALAKAHARVTNLRTQHHHTVSNALVERYDGVAAESLSVKNMVKNRYLAKSVHDASWSELLGIIKYKCEWRGKQFVQIDRFMPSSKTCHICGTVNNTLALHQRAWTCACGVHHDRDVNAAINIRNLAFR